MLVRRAFSRCHDNQVRTARLLGITRNTLRTLLKRHGLLSDAAAPDVVAEEAIGVGLSTSASPPPAPAYSF